LKLSILHLQQKWSVCIMKINADNKTETETPIAAAPPTAAYHPQRFDGRIMGPGRFEGRLNRTPAWPPGVEVLGEVAEPYREVLTPSALEFYARLHREFNPRRLALLGERDRRQEALDRGWLPDFQEETQALREGAWQVLPVPEDLRDRRVEITGPVDRKMVINALNSGANCYMADFEDAHSPTWEGTLEGNST
jgi:hypothetical protein